jgi:hypothetical protein
MKTFKQFLFESSYKDIKPEDLFNDWYNEIKTDIENYDGVDYIFDDFKNEYEEYRDDMSEQEIFNLPEFYRYMESEFDNRFEDFIYDMKRIVINNNNKIPIYRVLTVNDKFFSHLETTNLPKLGIYWSWDENSAEAHWGDWKKPNHILLQSEIDESMVNWKDTILLNINSMLGENEKEIRLYENTPLKILGIINKKTKQKYDISKIKDKTFRA